MEHSFLFPEMREGLRTPRGVHHAHQLPPYYAVISGLVNAWNMGMIPIYQEPFLNIGMEEVNNSIENIRDNSNILQFHVNMHIQL